MCRDTGQAASNVLNIKDEVLATDFNLAVTLRLLTFDNEKDEKNKRFWVEMVTGKPAESPRTQHEQIPEQS